MAASRVSRWLSRGALLLALAACDSPEERVAKHFERGLALVEQGETAKARIEFRNALRLDGDHALSLFELGRLNEASGDFRLAFTHYSRAAEADPTHLGARLKLAQFLLAGGALDQALRYADEAYALAPTDAETLATRAGVLYRLGDVDGALKAARASLAVDGRSTGAHLVIVAHLSETQGQQAALAYVDEALAAQRDDVSLNTVKLRLLAAGDDAAALEAHLRTLVEIFPEEDAYPQALARLYAQSGDLDAAEAQLRALADRAPDEPGSAVMLTQFLLEMRGEAAALAEIAARSAAAPTVTRTALRMIQSEIEYRAGRVDAARATLEGVAAEGGEAADAAIVRLANIDMDQGSLDAAAARLGALLERDPDNVDALALRAAIEIDQYRPEDAVLTLRRALNLAPQNVQLLMLEARAHERNGNPTLAGERLASATRESGFAPEIALRYAAFLRGRNQTVAAEGVLAEAARLHPSDRAVLSALAQLRLSLSDFSGAADVAERLRALDGGGAVADQIAASALAAEGRLEESASLLERAVADADAGAGALASLVATYVRQGERDRAAAFLDGLIADNPDNVRAAILRAELHLLAGEVDQGRRALERIAAAAPADPTPHVVLARFHLAQGDPDGAERAAREGIARARRTDGLRFILAEILERRGAFDEAIETYRSLYEENPESIVVANNLASLIAEFREDDPDAMAFAARVARRLRGSDTPHFQDTYGWIAFLSGDLNEAIRALSAAAQGLPDHPLVRYHFGRALAAAGETDRARRELEASLAIDPSFSKAASARAVLDDLPAGGG